MGNVRGDPCPAGVYRRWSAGAVVVVGIRCGVCWVTVGVCGRWVRWRVAASSVSFERGMVVRRFGVLVVAVLVAGVSSCCLFLLPCWLLECLSFGFALDNERDGDDSGPTRTSVIICTNAGNNCTIYELE